MSNWKLNATCYWPPVSMGTDKPADRKQRLLEMLGLGVPTMSWPFSLATRTACQCLCQVNMTGIWHLPG